jgi:hypothetical protein
MDELYETVFGLVKAQQRSGEPRRVLFRRVWQAAATLVPGRRRPDKNDQKITAEPIPALSEAWY